MVDDSEVVGLARYLWNIKLCESLYPVFQLLEVGFRNAVHYEVGHWQQEPNWLLRRPSILCPSEQLVLEKAKAFIAQTRRPLDEGHLIAGLSFGFWTSLLDVRYERWWPQIIRGVFPDLPARHRTRKTVSGWMNPVRHLRNWAFHHHAIWNHPSLASNHLVARSLLDHLGSSLGQVAAVMDDFPQIFRQGHEPYIEQAERLLKTKSTTLLA